MQLDSVQENERRRIARELHDSLGQYLTALDIGLKSVQEMEGCTDAVAGSLQRLRELAMSIDENVDRLAFELHPRELDDLGLEDTLRRHVQQWSAASGIAVSMHFRGLDHDHLSPLVETTVYRIIQDVLNGLQEDGGPD